MDATEPNSIEIKPMRLETREQADTFVRQLIDEIDLIWPPDSDDGLEP
jgi:hypothetical protein